MPGVNIQAPSLKPPRVSILTSADVIALTGDRWFGGIHFKRLSGNPALGAPVLEVESEADDTFILPICPVDTTAKIQWPRGEDDSSIPFAVYATESCSGFGISAADILDRATQKLTVNEAWTIEHELWFGTATANTSLADANIDLGTGFSPVVGFATIDAAVAQDRTDGRGMIYVTARTFDLLQQFHLFRREGNVWFSPLDNVVVPMRVPEADDETDSLIYGHPGTLLIAHSDIFTFPQDAGGLEKAMNTSTNDLQAVAERVVAYVIPSENIYKIEVDQSLSGSGGSGGGGDASAANQTAGNAILTDIETAVDGLETAVAATNTLLTTQDGRLANLEDSLTADSATLSNVADQDTNIQLLASNANRRGVIVHNDSPGILYLKYGTTASVTSYTYKIAADGSWDMPMPIYTGQIDGIWTSSASGSARITELA